MREDLYHKGTGTPILEWIEYIPGSIRDTFEGMGGIVAVGRGGYGLEGEELVEFARRCLYSLLNAGAVPALQTKRDEDDYNFVPVETYGLTADTIVETILAEWIANGMPDLDFFDYAFTNPENINPKLFVPYAARRARAIAEEARRS